MFKNETGNCLGDAWVYTKQSDLYNLGSCEGAERKY